MIFGIHEGLLFQDKRIK